ncbi:MAG TPA: TonB C-terminal domain-containing protein [Anaeromyxobacteraceae bacterium]
MTSLGPSLRRARRRSRPWIRFAGALAVSLLVNAALLRAVHVGGISGPAKGGPVQRPVALAPLSPSQWEANRWAAPAQPTPPAAPPPTAALVPPPPPPPPNRMKGQVVDVAPSKDATPPKESRFLAEHDSTVEKETRSKHARGGYENTLPTPSDPKPSRPTPIWERERGLEAGEGGREGVKAPGARPLAKPPEAAAGRAPLPDQPARERLALAPDASGDVRAHGEQQEVRGNAGAPSLGDAQAARAPENPTGDEGRAALPGKAGPLSQLQLRPSASTYDRLAGGPAPDRLENVEEGEGTFLNTKSWKYAGYINRIKQAVQPFWDPNKAWQSRDPGGTRFTARDYSTLVVVKLDDRGSLKEAVVEKSSGLEFLDSVAVQAFYRAQPFVNPPRGLADERGEIVFAFGFTFEASLGLDRIFRGAIPTR